MPAPERIYKLQPNRTLALRGFDHLGASAALHSATENSFKVSGVFRDTADFAVLILHDADNFYDHPRIKYLPDFDFEGLTLSFDVRYEGLMPLDSMKFPSIDWPYLDVIRGDGTRPSDFKLPNGTKPDPPIRLSDHAVRVGTPNANATASFTIEDNGLLDFDRLTLWYLDKDFDLIASIKSAFFIDVEGAGFAHTITVAGSPYTYVEVAGDTQFSVAQGLLVALASCPEVQATVGDNSPENGPANQINIRTRQLNAGRTTIVYQPFEPKPSQTIHGASASAVAAVLANEINSATYREGFIPLRAQANGPTINVTSVGGGIDANMIRMYAVSKNARLRTTSDVAVFSGATSTATFRVTLNFSTLNIPKVRMMWLTFAPPLANGAPFESTEWEATFTNWTLSGPDLDGPNDKRVLKVAGQNSVRIEENDAWCTYTGNWSVKTGFFSQWFAKLSNTAGDTVVIRYVCPIEHDLYVGTSIHKNHGSVRVQLDSGTGTFLSCQFPEDPNSTVDMAAEATVNTRRRVLRRVPAGEHVVRIEVVTGPFVFDFLEAAVPTDIPPPLPTIANLSPALDYSTDHAFKLPASRIHWNFDALGFAGPMNEYIGVFWWNQRKREGGMFPKVTVTFAGDFANGDQVSIFISGQECRRVVYPNENAEILARHFAFFLNTQYVGVWASASGNQLTITNRSPQPTYEFNFECSKTSTTNSSGTVSFTGSLKNGDPGLWVVDPTQYPALNRGARDWHSDMFRECGLRNRELVVATSMELVNPPPGFAAVYPDGDEVVTDVGFGSLMSTHCAFVSPMLEYHKKVYRTIAELAAAQNVRPSLQYGEFLWWFFTNYRTAVGPGPKFAPINLDGGMAFYHPEIKLAAKAVLGQELAWFKTPTDDPSINGGADARFLANWLREYVNARITDIRASHPNVRLELLFPYDVNHPEPEGIHKIGGKLNRFVNLPVEWETKATSNLDGIKTEALDFGVWSHSLDLAKKTIHLPIELGWPRDSIRHLVGVFRGGYPWEKEVALAEAAGIPAINLWAFDQVCLFGWPSTPKPVGRVTVI